MMVSDARGANAHSVLLLLLGIASAVNGCGGGTGRAGGAPACSNVMGPASGDTCNAITASGPCVTGTFSTDAPPTPAGGAFTAGTYNLVSEIFYGPAAVEPTFQSGIPFRQTYVLSNVTSTSFTLDNIEATGTVVARSRETVAVSGMTATFTQTCPPPDAGVDLNGTWQFTATSTAITMFWPTTSEVLEVTVYDKAP